MLSRIANNLYWMARYVERAENTARLLDVNYHAMIEAPSLSKSKGIVAEQWAPLLDILGSEDAFYENYERADRNSVPEWLAFRYDNPGSLYSSISHARENARALRDRISSEMWEAINRAYFELCTTPRGRFEGEMLHDYCVKAREISHVFFGIADATLPRDLGWYFLRTGQYLERADNVARTLMVRYRHYGKQEQGQSVAIHRSLALLRSLSAYEAFLKRYHSMVEPQRIANFLLLDAEFPRSLHFCLRVLAEITEALLRYNPDTSNEAQRKAGWLYAQIAYTQDSAGMVAGGSLSLEQILEDLSDISDTLNSIYFNHQSPQPSLSMQLQEH